MQQFIYTVLRKVAFGVGLAIVTWCINNHLFTQAQLDTALYALAGLIVMAVTALWTEYILPWLKRILNRPVSTALPTPPTLGAV